MVENGVPRALLGTHGWSDFLQQHEQSNVGSEKG